MLEAYDDVLSVDEACEALKVGHNAIYELLNSGKLKAYKNGRVWRIPKESIKQYILENAGLQPYDKNTTKYL